jgi:hypothetical protein
VPSLDGGVGLLDHRPAALVKQSLMPADPSRRAVSTVRSLLRHLVAATGLVVTLLAGFPALVSADCNGPTCGEPTPAGVEGVSAFVFLAILVVFGTVMAIAEARRR